MAPERWILYNGEFRPAGEALLTAGARPVLYGDGCFETFRSYEGSLLHFRDHLERMEEGLGYLHIDIPKILEYNKLESLIKKLLNRNNLAGKPAAVRLQVWREGERGYRPAAHASTAFVLSCGPLPESTSTLKLATVSTRRIPTASVSSRYKLSGGTNYIRAASEAVRKGADDALMLTTDGKVSETTIANIFWLSGDTVYTPSEACDLLPGITRGILLELLGRLDGVQVSEGVYGPEELKSAEAAWVCNSLREIQPVSHLDDVTYRTSHPVLDGLREAFDRYVKDNLKPLQP